MYRPEAVAYSRTLGRALVPTDLQPGYPPAVRFYFRWDELAELPVARFDGVHPIKTSGALDIAELLVGVIVGDDQAASLLERAHPAIRDRIVVLRAANPAPHEWAAAATGAAERLA